MQCFDLLSLIKILPYFLSWFMYFSQKIIFFLFSQRQEKIYVQALQHVTRIFKELIWKQTRFLVFTLDLLLFFHVFHHIFLLDLFFLHFPFFFFLFLLTFSLFFLLFFCFFFSFLFFFFLLLLFHTSLSSSSSFHK